MYKTQMDALTSIASSPKQKKHFLSNSEYYFPLSICKTTGRNQQLGSSNHNVYFWVNYYIEDPFRETDRLHDEPIKVSNVLTSSIKTFLESSRCAFQGYIDIILYITGRYKRTWKSRSQSEQ